MPTESQSLSVPEPTPRHAATTTEPRCCSPQQQITSRRQLGWTALLEAVILGDGSADYVEIVNILLDNGADRRSPTRTE